MKQALIAATIALLATAAHAQATTQTLTADVKSAAGETIGAVVLTQAADGVLARVQVHGLTPGWHGMHFHERGDCSAAGFTAAGAHIHHGMAMHGLLNPMGAEMGDLPNLFVGDNGVGASEVFSSRVALKDLRDADGSALIIHANPDDHVAQPIGGAGPRIACALIR